jgi:SAM-dependent methyltransferase
VRSHQDFELYADQKLFSYEPAPTWVSGLERAADLIGKPLRDLDLLDLGCGDGKIYPFLMRRGFSPSHVHGVEVSETRLERCRQIGWHNVRFLVPGQALSFPAASFDIVNMLEVIEHVPAAAADALIADVCRVLRPGGVLLITTPNYPIKRFYDFWDAIVHGKHARFRDDPTHVTRYSHARLAELLRRHFRSLEERDFKSGFLYRRLPWHRLRHKMFYLASA